VFFGGGLTEVLIAGLIGVVLAVLERFIGGAGRFVLVPVAATLGTTLAHAGQALVGTYRADIVTLGGLLYLLPGLTLTVALT
jgi:uncharacterized membrane protein YjjP (DUF1212 family)